MGYSNIFLRNKTKENKKKSRFLTETRLGQDEMNDGKCR